MNDDDRMIAESLEVCAAICTEWECDFLTSIQERRADGRELTEKQRTILRNIYEKVCASPY